MILTRREFLEKGMIGFSAVSLSHLFPGLTLFARASDRSLLAPPWRGAQDHFFVLVRTVGGMDCTLGLDPQILPAGATEEDLFLEYRPEDIKQASGLRLGPAATGLIAFADSCAIINGVMMRRDAGHEPLNQYMLSGRGDGSAASLPVELSTALGAGPYGVVFNGSIFTAAKTPVLTSLDDILNDKNEISVPDILKPIVAGDNSGNANSGTPLENSERNVVSGSPEAQKLMAILAQFRKDYPTVEAKHALAAALASGVAYHAQIDINSSGNLDTHSNHPVEHLKMQKEIWDGVAGLFALFKKVPFGQGSLFDSTTFMIMTEFSRTPALNQSKGKDHNPFTNSVLFAGKGIQGGRVIGASELITRAHSKTGDPLHIAAPFNFKEGKLATSRDGASFFLPENVARTVGEIFGNPPGLALSPSVPVIPGLVKT